MKHIMLSVLLATSSQVFSEDEVATTTEVATDTTKTDTVAADTKIKEKDKSSIHHDKVKKLEHAENKFSRTQYWN